jgi:hypothetical protein
MAKFNKKTPLNYFFSGNSSEVSQNQQLKNTPFPEKSGMRMRPIGHWE